MLTKLNQFTNKHVRFVYVMVPGTIRYLYRAKIGISQNPKQRREQIIESIRQETGRRIAIGYIKLPFLMWGKTENNLLKITAYLYAKADMPGNGRTEWRWYLNVFTALLLSLLGREMSGHGEVWRFVAILLLPVPLDFFALVALAFLLEIMVVFGGLWLVYFIFSHLKF